jgi:hypothetical protein
MRPIISIPGIERLGKVKPVDQSYGFYSQFLAGASGFVRGWESAYSSFISYLLSMDDSVQDSSDGSYIYEMDSDISDNAKRYFSLYLTKQISFLNVVESIVSNLPDVPIAMGTAWTRLNNAIKAYEALDLTSAAGEFWGVHWMTYGFQLFDGSEYNTVIRVGTSGRTTRSMIEDLVSGVENFDFRNSDPVGTLDERFNIYTDSWTNINSSVGGITTDELMTVTAAGTLTAGQKSPGVTALQDRVYGSAIDYGSNELDAKAALADITAALDACLIESIDGTLPDLSAGTVAGTVPPYVGPQLAQVWIILDTISNDIGVDIPFDDTFMSELETAAGPYIRS